MTIDSGSAVAAEEGCDLLARICGLGEGLWSASENVSIPAEAFHSTCEPTRNVLEAVGLHNNVVAES